MLFQLADTQKDLAWKLDDHLLAVNQSVASKASSFIAELQFTDCVLSVARIPGIESLLMLQNGMRLPEQYRSELQKIMGESIGLIFYADDKNPNF